jgi:hypothetical protein
MVEQLVEVREVMSRADLKTFIAVPWPIFADDPNWVPPLKFERKEAFSPKNPYFLHARWKAWVAFRDGQPVGRISAQIDDLFLKQHDPHTGFFGLFESIDDPRVSHALFEAAEQWLKSQGMKKILGPFNLGINQEIGCLVDGFDSPPFIMMGHARKYYGDLIEGLGYSGEQDTLAYEIDREHFSLPKKVQRLLVRQGENMTLRPVDRKNTDEELEVLRDIFNDAWANNWGFVPFTREEFSAIGKELFMIVPPDFTLVAEADGEPTAFLIMLPNVNESIADLNGRLFPFGWAKLLWRLKVRFPKTGRIALMGVRRHYQNTLLGPALAFLLIQGIYSPARKMGIERVEMSWILQQNHAMRNIIEKVGGRVTKRYRMYGKRLS